MKHLDYTSWLIGNTLRHDLVTKAEDCGADFVFFDLEDSVPANRRSDARADFVVQLDRVNSSGERAMGTALRINELRSHDGLKDLTFLLERKAIPDVIVIPKPVLVSDCELVYSLLKPLKADVRIFALIETIAAYKDLNALRVRPESLHGVVFGSADFSASLRVDLNKIDLSQFKQNIGMSCRQLGITGVDTPCFNLKDPGALAKELAEILTYGFDGKVAVHPDQIVPIKWAFAPSDDQIAYAESILEAQRKSSSDCVHKVGTNMVGPPFLRQALTIIERADRMNLRKNG